MTAITELRRIVISSARCAGGVYWAWAGGAGSGSRSMVSIG
jgi:hypothetical protein